MKAAIIGIRTLADYYVWLKDRQHLTTAITVDEKTHAMRIDRRVKLAQN
jgi:hypothetical protein